MSSTSSTVYLLDRDERDADVEEAGRAEEEAEELLESFLCVDVRKPRIYAYTATPYPYGSNQLKKNRIRYAVIRKNAVYGFLDTKKRIYGTSRSLMLRDVVREPWWLLTGLTSSSSLGLLLLLPLLVQPLLAHGVRFTNTGPIQLVAELVQLVFLLRIR